MNKKRVVKINAALLAVIIIIGCSAILFTARQPSPRTQTSSQYAYRACRRTMLNTNGYSRLPVQSVKFQRFKAHFEFGNGSTTVACEAIGIGPIWIGRQTLVTISGCIPSIDNGTICLPGNIGITFPP